MAGHHRWEDVKRERRSAAEGEAVRRDSEKDLEGVTLAGARKAAGLTQQQVADAIGVRQSEVAQLERRQDVQVSTLRKYARALGGSIGIYLFDGERARKILIGEEAAEVQGERAAPAAAAAKASARKRAPKAGR